MVQPGDGVGGADGLHRLCRPAEVYPKIIPLPIGFRPEGISSGNGSEFYVGSLADGAIFKGDFRTGEGAILVPG